MVEGAPLLRVPRWDTLSTNTHLKTNSYGLSCCAQGWSPRIFPAKCTAFVLGDMDVFVHLLTTLLFRYDADLRLGATTQGMRPD